MKKTYLQTLLLITLGLGLSVLFLYLNITHSPKAQKIFTDDAPECAQYLTGDPFNISYCPEAWPTYDPKATPQISIATFEASCEARYSCLKDKKSQSVALEISKGMPNCNS